MACWFGQEDKFAGACAKTSIADEVRYSILPVLIGTGISFFEGLTKDVSLHLSEVKAYQNGIVALNHAIRRWGRNKQGISPFQPSANVVHWRTCKELQPENQVLTVNEKPAAEVIR